MKRYTHDEIDEFLRPFENIKPKTIQIRPDPDLPDDDPKFWRTYRFEYRAHINKIGDEVYFAVEKPDVPFKIGTKCLVKFKFKNDLMIQVDDELYIHPAWWFAPAKRRRCPLDLIQFRVRSGPRRGPENEAQPI